MNAKQSRRAVLAVGMLQSLSLVPAAHAGGGGGAAAASSIVFDPTNYGRNLITAAQSVRSVMVQTDQYLTQLMQLDRQIRNMRSLSGEALEALGGGDIRAKYNSAVRAYRTAEDLSRTIQRTQTMFEGRLADARNLKLDWRSYVQREEQRARAGSEEAQRRIKIETETYEQAQAEAEATIESYRQLAQAEPSLQAQSQMMNNSLLRLIGDFGDLRRLMATVVGGQGQAMRDQVNAKREEMAKEEAKRAAAAALGAESQRASRAAVDKATEIWRGSR